MNIAYRRPHILLKREGWEVNWIDCGAEGSTGSTAKMEEE